MIGFTAGQFDILHPGYVSLLSFAKANCNHLIVLLNGRPVGRPKPIFSVEERTQTLLALKYVDAVYPYYSESHLLDLIHDLERIYGKQNLVRFLGDDYKNKENYTGKNLNLRTLFHDRGKWSYSKYLEEFKKYDEERKRLVINSCLLLHALS
jgi:cytidyltransferase-like protein